MELWLGLELIVGLLFRAPSAQVNEQQKPPSFEEMWRRGNETFNDGRFRESEDYLRLAVVAADSSSDVLDGVRARVALAGVLVMAGRNLEAEELLESAVKAVQAHPDPDKSYLTLALINLGMVYRETGQYRNAEMVLNQARRLLRADSSDRRREIQLLGNLGVLYAVTGRKKLAQSTLKEAVTLEESSGHDPVHLARTLTNLATVYSLHKEWKLAEPLLVRAQQTLEGAMLSLHPEMAPVLINFGTVYFAQKDFIKAESVLRRALDIQRQALGSENLTVAFGERYLANALTMQDKFEEAETLYKDSLRIQERLLGPRSSDVALSLEHLAKMMRLKAEREATAMERRARYIRLEKEMTIPSGKPSPMPARRQ
jgi:tetratricopeptide (TPR) repeat protein